MCNHPALSSCRLNQVCSSPWKMLILIFTASDSGVGHWLQMSFQGTLIHITLRSHGTCLSWPQPPCQGTSTQNTLRYTGLHPLQPSCHGAFCTKSTRAAPALSNLGPQADASHYSSRPAKVTKQTQSTQRRTIHRTIPSSLGEITVVFNSESQAK